MRALLVGAIWSFSALAAPAPVPLIPLDGAIGPANAHFVRRALERAAKDGAPLVILRIDTPGGLDASMREVIKAILASPVPVAASWRRKGRARQAPALHLTRPPRRDGPVPPRAPRRPIGCTLPQKMKKEEDTITRR